MGSASHAVLTNKQNRALQRAHRKSFLNKDFYPILTSNYRVYTPNLNVSGNNARLKPKEVIYTLAFLFAITLVCILVDKKINKSIVDPSIRLLSNTKNQMFTSSSISYYKKLLQRADNSLECGDFRKAHNDYRRALFDIPKGRDALLGIMICNISFCEQPDSFPYRKSLATYCQLADSLKSQLMLYGNLSRTELDVIICQKLYLD